MRWWVNRIEIEFFLNKESISRSSDQIQWCFIINDFNYHFKSRSFSRYFNEHHPHTPHRLIILLAALNFEEYRDSFSILVNDVRTCVVVVIAIVDRNSYSFHSLWECGELLGAKMWGYSIYCTRVSGFEAKWGENIFLTPDRIKLFCGRKACCHNFQLVCQLIIFQLFCWRKGFLFNSFASANIYKNISLHPLKVIQQIFHTTLGLRKKSC